MSRSTSASRASSKSSSAESIRAEIAAVSWSAHRSSRIEHRARRRTFERSTSFEGRKVASSAANRRVTSASSSAGRATPSPAIPCL